MGKLVQENRIRMLCISNLIFVFGVGLAAASSAGHLIHRLPSSFACLALHRALLALSCPCAVLGVAPRIHPSAPLRAQASVQVPISDTIPLYSTAHHKHTPCR
jgi:hypothetical protein